MTSHHLRTPAPIAIVGLAERTAGAPLEHALLPGDAGRLDTAFAGLLEGAWRCMENGAQAATALGGSDTGVYLSARSGTDHAGALARHHALRAPCLQFDHVGGCPLVAVNEAVHALRRGACTQALAGALTPEGTLLLVLLKTLEQANHAGDPLHGIIHGAALLQAVRDPAQTRVAAIQAAVDDGGVAAAGIDLAGHEGGAGLLALLRGPRTDAGLVYGGADAVAALVVQPYRYAAPRMPEHSAAPARQARVVPLSAASVPHLRLMAQQLAAHIDAVGPDFDRLCYTLQAGRTAFPHRLACVAHDGAELALQLRAFGVGEGTPAGCISGVAAPVQAADRSGADEDVRRLVVAWHAKGKLAQLASYWIRGGELDWDALYPTEVPARLHLPGYPCGPAPTSPAAATGPVFDHQDIAIIGLSGRFPGASDIAGFWERLLAGDNCIREVPPERWDWRDYYSETRGEWGKIYNKYGGFIEEIDCFDPLFFQISPLEAGQMDPQERLFLEQAYACVEDAGYTPATLSPGNRVGVFAAVMNSAYSLVAEHWSIANRVSSVLNLNGPSVAIDTACSSSLTALHFACESLYRKQSDCALVGGISLITDPVLSMRVSARTMVTAGNACRAFGAGADGFVDAEGVGMVLIKPLARALADGDQVYGVIKATALNHGGKTRGYNVPSAQAQAAVIRQALSEAGCHARTVSYVEAHGTGTLRGDPIELSGLQQAFARDTEALQFCAIGSVKSNIGHCESAAGIAGLAKVLLQFKHRTLVASLHAQETNPRIDFAASPFFVQQGNAPWERPQLALDGTVKVYPRRAALSSFGGGGANAHVILEEGPDTPARTWAGGPVLVLLSARSAEQLSLQKQRLCEHIRRTGLDDSQLPNLSFTLQAGREAMAFREAWIVASMDELCLALSGSAAPRTHFAGQPAQTERAAMPDRDDALRLTLSQWLASGKLEQLARLWVAGLTPDWRDVWGEDHPVRISLPTYPFARERYWSPLVAPAREVRQPDPAPAPPSRPALAQDVLGFLIDAVADALRLPAGQIDPARPLTDYGVDSVIGMKLAQCIEQRYGIDVGGRDIFEQVTLGQLADKLGARAALAATPPEPLPDLAVRVLGWFKAGLLDEQEVDRMLEQVYPTTDEGMSNEAS
jgi:acyl transferase domain-containing protein